MELRADMNGRKSYSYPKGYILDTIHDIVELQHGRLKMSDAVHGRILYRIEMYGNEWILLYTVTENGKSNCYVTIEVCGECGEKDWELRREFALLDSMLCGGSDFEITEAPEENNDNTGLARAANDHTHTYHNF